MKENKSNIGRTVVSGAYGAGEVIIETHNTLTMRLLRCKTEVTVNKAGNLHYVAGPPISELQPCPECGSSTEHYLSCSESEQ